MNSRKFQIRLAVVLFLSVLGFSIFAQINSKEVPTEIYLGIIAAAITTYLGLKQFYIEHDKTLYDLFNKFNLRFEKLRPDLNKIISGEIKEEDKIKEVVNSYLNLCSEEYLWYKKGRIDKDIWTAWKNGIHYYLENKSIKKVFLEEKK